MLGVYIHYPWCRKLCPYCDFAVEVGTPEHELYADAIVAELARRAPAFEPPLISIYFGGGTPSLWQPACLARVITAVRDRFGGEPQEVTIEANPIDCAEAALAAWRAAGITRISIGVQSLHADELVVLGRDHRFGDGTAAVERACAAGFAVSADFILGTPVTSRRAEPPRVLGLADHLSIYELTIEDRTAFGARVRAGRMTPLPDDELAELYAATHTELTAAGYSHYEVSSYAKPGARAVHNSLYWAGTPYLGLGASAASLELASDGTGLRATNPRRVYDYLADAVSERIGLSRDELAQERAWLGMRTSDGVAAGDLPAGIADELVTGGLATRQGGRICPTLRGFLMNDRIAARIVQAW
jgi:oxygen-independent coproporphyrinogen III oxidase